MIRRVFSLQHLTTSLSIVLYGILYILYQFAVVPLGIYTSNSREIIY